MSDSSAQTKRSAEDTDTGSSKKAKARRLVKFGPHEGVDFPGAELQEMRTSNDLLDHKDFVGLRARFKAEGYLFLRGVLNREAVLEARRYVLTDFEKKGAILNPANAKEDGVLLKECGIGCVPFMEGKNDITHSAEVLNGVLESSEMKDFFKGLFGEAVRTFDFKWLRVSSSCYTFSLYCCCL